MCAAPPQGRAEREGRAARRHFDEREPDVGMDVESMDLGGPDERVGRSGGLAALRRPYPPITMILFPSNSEVRSQSRSSQLRSGRTSNTTSQPWSRPTVSK